MIHIEGLSRRFGSITAVDSVSLDVNDGEVFALLGPNGAGKTTLVRMLACLIAPSGGSATLNGLSIGEGCQEIRKIIGYLPENPGLYEDLTPVQNLRFFGELHGMDGGALEQRITDLLDGFSLSEKRDVPVSTLSKGMRQRLALARTIIHEPQILFLDEPTTGLDPEAVAMVRSVILGLRKGGRTIFLNTHNLDEAERLCDRIAIFNKNILAIGSPNELSRRFWGTKVVFTIEGELSAALIDRIRSIEGVLDAFEDSVSGSRLLKVVATEPESVNFRVVDILSGAGVKVVYINQETHSLEEVYHRVIGRGRV